MLGSGVPIVCHAEGIDYLRRLLCLVRNFDFRSECRDLDLCGFEDPTDGSCLVRDADA